MVRISLAGRPLAETSSWSPIVLVGIRSSSRSATGPAVINSAGVTAAADIGHGRRVVHRPVGPSRGETHVKLSAVGAQRESPSGRYRPAGRRTVPIADPGDLLAGLPDAPVLSWVRRAAAWSAGARRPGSR